LLRRHFFLASALAILVVMVVAGGLKLAMGHGQGGSGAGASAAGSPAGKSAGKSGGKSGGGPTPVSVVAVQPRTFVDTIDVLGVAKGRQSVTLSAATTQLVERVRFHDGESVPRGAVLVELKNTEQDAGLAQAQARVVEAKRAYERWRSLSDKGFASKASLDQYEATYLSAQADVAAAQARRGDRTIRAPFAGVVGLSDIAPGALINPGAPIVTLDDLSSVRVDFQVPERYLSVLHEGQTIKARADAYPGEAIVGRIARLDTRVDEKTRAITARADFPNTARRLKPGMMIRIAISRGQRQALSVPESAVSVQGDEAFVFVLSDAGGKTTAEQRPVATGDRQEGFVELREGVAANERVVADGLNKMQGGQSVKIVHTPAAGARRPS